MFFPFPFGHTFLHFRGEHGLRSSYLHKESSICRSSRPCPLLSSSPYLLLSNPRHTSTRTLPSDLPSAPQLISILTLTTLRLPIAAAPVVDRSSYAVNLDVRTLRQAAFPANLLTAVHIDTISTGMPIQMHYVENSAINAL